MSDLRCWLCGVEPTAVADIGTFNGPESMPSGWPEGDHDHAVKPPTPDELFFSGVASYDRAMREWT